MIILTDTENALDKIQYLFMTKKTQQTGYISSLLYIYYNIYDI